MELPINIIIIMFVAVAVGIALIYFSSDVFMDARQDLNRLGIKNIDDESKIVEVDGIVTASMIRALSEECVKRSEAVPLRDLCFVIRGSQQDIGSVTGNTTNLKNFTINATPTLGGANVTMMYYDPTRKTIWVEH